MIGGGVRIQPRNLALFEAVLDTIVRTVPSSTIALVASPQEAAP